jgi:hypothetical protein
VLKRARDYQDVRVSLIVLVILSACSAGLFFLALMGAGMENETPPGLVAGLFISLVVVVAAVIGLWEMRRPPPPHG